MKLSDFIKLCKDRGLLAADMNPEDLEAAVLAQNAKEEKRAAPPPSPTRTTARAPKRGSVVEIALDSDETQHDREEITKLIPHLNRLP